MELGIISFLRKGWLEVGSTRMVLLEVRGGFYALRESLEMLVGPDVTERVLYEAGAQGGISYARSAVSSGAVPDGISGFTECVRVYSEAGFGDFHVEDIDGAQSAALVRCKDSFESWAYQEHGRFSSRPVCDYSSGVLAGFMRSLTGRHDVECAEIECRVLGAPECVFQVRVPQGEPSERRRPVGVWDVAVLARENARLRADAERRSEQLARQNESLSMLVELVAATRQSQDLGDVFRQTLMRVTKHYRADAGGMWLLDGSARHLLLADHFDLPSNLASCLAAIPLEGFPFETGSEITSRIRLMEVSSERWAPASLLAEAGFQVAALVGLASRERPLGCMMLLWKRPSGLGDEDLSLLNTVGHHVSIAIENARLMQSATELAVTQERNRIARELHDSVNQTLFGIILALDTLLHSDGLADSGEALSFKPLLQDVRDMASKALQEMRGIVSQLRPLGLDGESLPKALVRYAEWVRSQTGVCVDVAVSGISDEVSIDPQAGDALYRIAQEALNNAVKHSSATRVVIHVSTSPERVRLEVRDNGCGFVPERVLAQGRHGSGLGLTTMRERAQLLGGSLCVRSKLGRGTIVTAEVPRVPEIHHTS